MGTTGRRSDSRSAVTNMSLQRATLLLLLLAAAAASKSTSRPKHLVFMLADDLGWYDTSVFGDQSAETRNATHNITALADAGVRLSRHYVHWHCSPSRRSFISGRNPLHHGEQLSNVDTDDIDLRWTWISEKLHQQNYISHWYGKGHTGYKSMQHMPANRGFNGGRVLYLGGAGSYYNLERWNGTEPMFTKKTNPDEYSTDLFGSLAVEAIKKHDTSRGLFLYLPWQAVHAPYDVPPSCRQQGGTQDCPNLIRAMIHDVDIWTGRLVAALKERHMYEDTLLVFTSDNGGTQDPFNSTKNVGGNNYPLRGGKHSNWQGGMRTQTFISGGLVPTALRGSTNNATYHIADWHPTFCKLSGSTDCTDNSAVAPLPVNVADPTKDIYGTDAFPPLDGTDIWPQLTAETPQSRPYMWLSAEVMIKDGRYKLLTAQQNPKITNSPPMTGWRQQDNSWVDGGELDGAGCGVAFRVREHFKPCLFDLSVDEREQHDLSLQMPELVQEIWSQLNRTALTAFLSRSPNSLEGKCTPRCAVKKWNALYGTKSGQGPICDVPGCA